MCKEPAGEKPELHRRPQFFRACCKPTGLGDGGMGSLACPVSKPLISGSMRTRVGLLVCKVFFL